MDSTGTVKTEQDLDPYFLSFELFSRKSTIHPDDQDIKLDLLDLKSEIKSELSTDEYFSFEDAEKIVDPFEDCVKPEIEQVNTYGLPQHSCETLNTFQKDELQHPTTPVKDLFDTEMLVLTEPEELNQDGRVCHLLRYSTQVNKRLEEQHSESYTAKTKLKDRHVSSSVEVHKQIHTREEPHIEPVCGKSEMNTGQPRKRFPCSQCDKTFAFPTGLRFHMRRHTGERPYQCHTCGKDFSRSDFLAMHMKSHERIQTGERPFECDQCGKTLTSRGFLQLHKERLHGFSTKEDGQKEKQFSCGICGKAFVTKRYLKSHEGTHTDRRPYVCTQCGHSFRRKDSLTKHMRIHSRERPYSCGYCGKTFPYTASLKNHIEIHKRTKK